MEHSPDASARDRAPKATGIETPVIDRVTSRSLRSLSFGMKSLSSSNLRRLLSALTASSVARNSETAPSLVARSGVLIGSVVGQHHELIQQRQSIGELS